MGYTVRLGLPTHPAHSGSLIGWPGGYSRRSSVDS